MEIRILDRKESVKEIKKLIYYAKEELIIISPYIDIKDDYKEELEKCRAKDKLIVFREGQFLKDYKLLKSLKFHLMEVKDLHAKIYMNENYVLFSSMNLYRYSMENNHETSIMVKREYLSDKDLNILFKIAEYGRMV